MLPLPRRLSAVFGHKRQEPRRAREIQVGHLYRSAHFRDLKRAPRFPGTPLACFSLLFGSFLFPEKSGDLLPLRKSDSKSPTNWQAIPTVSSLPLARFLLIRAIPGYQIMSE